jgi:isochorismate pyruvate lyase
MIQVKDPQECQDMADVRAGVDDVDRQIVSLLGRRFGYMDAAARIKRHRSTVRDETRKAEVINKVRNAATEVGVDEDLVATLYDQLIEGSIAYELTRFDQLERERP